MHALICTIVIRLTIYYCRTINNNGRLATNKHFIICAINITSFILHFAIISIKAHFEGIVGRNNIFNSELSRIGIRRNRCNKEISFKSRILDHAITNRHLLCMTLADKTADFLHTRYSAIIYYNIFN